MKTYKIFKHPIGDYVAIKNGFSWSGFLFCVFGALYKQMWLLAIYIITMVFGILVILGIIGLSEAQLNTAGNIISISLAVYFGLKENELYENHILDKGYYLVKDNIIANNPEMTIAKVLKEEGKFNKD
jgi:hypothetical protein